MKASISFLDLELDEVTKLVAAAKKLGISRADEDEDDDDDEEETKPKSKRGSKKSKQKQAEDDDDDSDEDESDDDSDEDDGDESDVGDDDEDDDDGPTLAQVMSAFKSFVKKHKGDKKKAIPILKQFKVKSPNDLKEKDYAKVIKLLSK